jgi:leucyl-tRNA---protein transferase
MTLPNDAHLQQLQFYATTSYPCGYLEDRQARSLIAAPYHLVDTRVYSELIRQGFRRSGKFAYRPCCEHCQACVPVRLPVREFQPNRSQRRVWKQHAKLEARVLELQYRPEHYQLYRAYQQTRHPGGGMDNDGVEQYGNFLAQSNVDTVLVEFSEQGQLRMVSVVDCVRDGLSAVYTFYDCTQPNTSYGTYGILWLAEWCRTLELPYLYLGYWIKESPKMAYKARFKPLQGLLDGQWRVMIPAETTSTNT